MVTMVFGLFWLIWILGCPPSRVVSTGCRWRCYRSRRRRRTRRAAGWRTPRRGEWIIDSLGYRIGTPLGIMAGIYLAEYGRKSQLAEIIRFINDILLSAPSIVVGLLVYTIVVAQMQHFSGWAG